MRRRQIVDEKGNIIMQRYYSPAELSEIRQKVCALQCRQEVELLRKHRKEIQYKLWKEYENEYMKEYNQKPEVKQRMKEYYNKPEIKQRIKQRMREYQQRPEVKQRMREYYQEYYQKPEVKQRIKEYQQEYYQKRKKNKQERA